MAAFARRDEGKRGRSSLRVDLSTAAWGRLRARRPKAVTLRSTPRPLVARIRTSGKTVPGLIFVG